MVGIQVVRRNGVCSVCCLVCSRVPAEYQVHQLGLVRLGMWHQWGGFPIIGGLCHVVGGRTCGGVVLPCSLILVRTRISLLGL